MFFALSGVLTLLRTVPRIPIRQCSFVLTKTASVLSSCFLRRIGMGPPDFHCSISAWLVLTHTMSSARRNPHLCKSARPTSKESLLGSHKNRKLGVAASDSIGRDANCVISAKWSRPPCSETTITSKRKPWAGGWIGDGKPQVSRDKRLSHLQSILRVVGGCDLWNTSAFFSSANLRNQYCPRRGRLGPL